MSSRTIRTLVVDDSALVRRILTDMLNSAPDIEVVGTAADPYIAREKIKQLNPDVLTLDVEMPRMDGIEFLERLMRNRPTPVIMVSTLTEKGADITLRALELGAIDFVTKPSMDVSSRLGEYVDELVRKVRAAASVNTRSVAAAGRTVQPAPAPQAPVGADRHAAARFSATSKIIAIGASTGGTEAIREVLSALPADSPGILIAQHIPPGFSTAFADRMNRQTTLAVKEAEDGDEVRPGHAFVAPGNRHLRLQRQGARYLCRVSDDDPVNRHRPSVSVLFRSVLAAAPRNCVAALLTGMGADGAPELCEMHAAGVHTIAQDEATSIVWGMPGEAVNAGGASEVLPLNLIAGALLRAFGIRQPA